MLGVHGGGAAPAERRASWSIPTTRRPTGAGTPSSTRGVREHVRLEQAYYRKDGAVVWTDLTVSLLRDSDGAPQFTVAMVEDITDRHQLEERLRHQALHDPLTGLPNRTFFAERLAEAFAATDPGAQVGLCYLDLDGFKRINDSLGHDVGDRLLVAVARRLQRCASAPRAPGGPHGRRRVRDPLRQGRPGRADRACRAGAEQPGPARARRARTACGSRRASASSRSRSPRSGPAEILKAADLTLYRAKAAGRGRWARYDAELNAAQVARYALVEALPDAVQRGEFSLLYQPLVSLPTGRACGVEALLRWHHPSAACCRPTTSSISPRRAA